MRTPNSRLAGSTFCRLAERHTILQERNDTARPIASATLPDLFAAQVAETPDAVAVVFEDATLTYAQLDARANQLAHHLQSLGVGPEVVVGLCIERSLEMVVGLLGILKAGGAFVPIDPAFPAERMAYMLEDAQARVLLSQERLLDRLPADGPRVLCLDRDWASFAVESDAEPENRALPENLAYVMYTSGSTGRPKGVLIPHRGFINYLVWCVEAYGAATGIGAPVYSSIAADAGFPNLFGPLLAGTQAILLSEELPLEALAAALQQDQHFQPAEDYADPA